MNERVPQNFVFLGHQSSSWKNAHWAHQKPEKWGKRVGISNFKCHINYSEKRDPRIAGGR